MIGVELETLEAKLSEGGGDDRTVDLYNRLAGGQRRLLESLGLERKARPVESVTEYLQRKTDEKPT